MTKKRFEFDEAERSALAYLVGRELASNRYPNAPHLEPFKSAFAKLAPADKVPEPPVRPLDGAAQGTLAARPSNLGRNPQMIHGRKKNATAMSARSADSVSNGGDGAFSDATGLST
jgi:hypothetical protein